MKHLLPGVLAMAIIVVASNILVQYPMAGHLGAFGEYLTWGALTYPFSFLVNDIVNRLRGASAARQVVLAGFVAGLACSVIGSQIQGEFGPLVTLRVAIGSGTAFLIGQLLDVTVFDRLRRAEWWRAPLVSTLLGSSIDSVIFFSLAFATAFTFLEPGNDVSWAAAPGPLLGIGPEVPYWVSLAVADWCVKFAIALFGLLPFRLIVARNLAPIA
jgi:queuosine precursor transporter